MKRNKRFGYVVIERGVYRVPLRALKSLESYMEAGRQDEVDEIMAAIRRSSTCTMVCEVDHVLQF